MYSIVVLVFSYIQIAQNHWICVTNLSQLCPVVCSLQSKHCPVWGSHCSACPLQVHGRQLGKPQCPGRQRSHWRPYAPGIHSHWPVASWQNACTEPCGSHSHAEGKKQYALIWDTCYLCVIVRSEEVWNSMNSVSRSEWDSRLHPWGPNRNVEGAHLSQFLPTTLGRHWHWPPFGSHTVLRDPWGSHWHAVDVRKRKI